MKLYLIVTCAALVAGSSALALMHPPGASLAPPRPAVSPNTVLLWNGEPVLRVPPPPGSGTYAIASASSAVVVKQPPRRVVPPRNLPRDLAQLPGK